MAEHGHGTTLAGATAGTIGEVISLSTNRTRDAIDVSSCDSTNKARDFLAGMRDAGEITCELNYDGSAAGVANSLDGVYETGTAEAWTITFPDTATFACSGFITALGEAVDFEGKVTQSLTIKLTGDPTFTDVA